MSTATACYTGQKGLLFLHFYFFLLVHVSSFLLFYAFLTSRNQDVKLDVSAWPAGIKVGQEDKEKDCKRKEKDHQVAV